MPTFDELVPNDGFLSDRQIQAALQAGHLMETGTWDTAQLRHASYTLRLGDLVHLCKVEEAAHQQRKTFAVVRLGAASPVLELEPGDTALLYSMENLRFPANIIGFTVARGLLFAESLAPENTYVDPGFGGNLYTTVTNVSNRVIRLAYKMPIARLFFYKLPEPVEKPYRTGAAMNIAQELETIPVSGVGTVEQCAKANRSDLLSIIRKIPLGGVPISELFARNSRSFARLATWSVVWPVLLVVANTNQWLRHNLGAFFSNVIASILGGVFLLFAPRLYRRFLGL